MRKVPLTVLFMDSMLARIYLAMLLKHGLLPEKVIVLKTDPPIFGEQLFELGAEGNDIALSERWREKHPVPDFLAERLLAEFGLTFADLYNCLSCVPETIVSELRIKNLKDPKLLSALRKDEDQTFLFTGGGILDDKLLSLANSKFIHIHPGFLPDVRGADGLLWSYLLRGKPGYTVFFMNEGIDTGDILYRQEFDLVDWEGQLNDIPEYSIYVGLLQFYDPCLRIITLIEFIENCFAETTQSMSVQTLMSMPARQQTVAEGRTYFFMTKLFRERVIHKFIQEKPL